MLVTFRLFAYLLPLSLPSAFIQQDFKFSYFDLGGFRKAFDLTVLIPGVVCIRAYFSFPYPSSSVLFLEQKHQISKSINQRLLKHDH